MYKNEIIQCPRCKLDLYSSKCDQYTGQIIKAENFMGIGLVPDPKHLSLAICIECGTPWGQFGKVHVKNVGWTGGLKNENTCNL